MVCPKRVGYLKKDFFRKYFPASQIRDFKNKTLCAVNEVFIYFLYVAENLKLT